MAGFHNPIGAFRRKAVYKYDFGVWINVNNTGYMVRKTSIENYYLAVALSNGLCGLTGIVLTYLFLLIKFWLIKYRDLKRTDKLYQATYVAASSKNIFS